MNYISKEQCVSVTSQGRNSKLKSRGSNHREILLTGLLLCSSSTTQDYLSRGGTSHSEMGSPVAINNSENATQTYLQAHLTEIIPQLRLSRITLDCVKLTANNSETIICTIKNNYSFT